MQSMHALCLSFEWAEVMSKVSAQALCVCMLLGTPAHQRRGKQTDIGERNRQLVMREWVKVEARIPLARYRW